MYIKEASTVVSRLPYIFESSVVFIPIYIPSSILNSHFPPYLTLLGSLIPFNLSLYSSVFYLPSLESLHVLSLHLLNSPGSATAAQVDRALSSNVQASLGSRPPTPQLLWPHLHLAGCISLHNSLSEVSYMDCSSLSINKKRRVNL